MEQLMEIGVTIFLSYLVLVAGVLEQKYTDQGENDDNRATNQHVKKTIQTKDGDVFDCIDINRQPAFDNPLLKDHVMQLKPSSYPSGDNVKFPSISTVSKSFMPSIECPAGTIPILRNYKGGIKTSLSVGTMAKSYVHEGEVCGIKTTDEIYGTQVSINIYEPEVRGKEDSSASWARMINGPDGNYDGIAAGSIVSQRFHGDNFARFHIYWEATTQNLTECYDHLCPGFVQVSSSIGIGGRIQPVSIYNGTQYKIDILLFMDPKTKDWWLAYGESKTPIGYWPSSLFKYLRDKAEISIWGGNVYGPTIRSNGLPQMGSGHYANEGFGKAAFVRDIKIINEKNELVTPDVRKSFAGTSGKKCYSVDGYGHDDGGMHLYFGGPGGCN